MIMLVINNSSITVELAAFVCDAPVRSGLKNIKSHTGYNSCERCTITGEYVGNRVVLRRH